MIKNSYNQARVLVEGELSMLQIQEDSRCNNNNSAGYGIWGVRPAALAALQGTWNSGGRPYMRRGDVFFFFFFFCSVVTQPAGLRKFPPFLGFAAVPFSISIH